MDDDDVDYVGGDGGIVFTFFIFPWCKARRSQGNLTVDWAKYKGGQRGSYQSLCQQHHHHLL